MKSTPEMVDSVILLILADGLVTIEDVAKQLRISVSTVQKLFTMTLHFLRL